MKCIILAAGTSDRIRPLTDDMPKCLLQVGHKTILERAIENLRYAAIREIGLVIGYRAEVVREFVKTHFPLQRIRLIVNPRYATTGNAFSLLMSREFYEPKGSSNQPLQDLLILDGDIVFPRDLIPFLLNHQGLDAVAVRATGDHDLEEVRVKVDQDKNILEIGKDVLMTESYGESIGIEVFSSSTASLLFDVIEQRVREGKGRTEFYESAFQVLVSNQRSLRAVDISAFPAIEIDTPEDLQSAESLIIPKIDESREGE